ncbi:MAG: hypothetical protein LQ350_005212 [Teloschistes chrysophthalmus]|nr:MAG: hypothetical protein LQ350_005212 [Niorma chrysophthalma]
MLLHVLELVFVFTIALFVQLTVSSPVGAVKPLSSLQVSSRPHPVPFGDSNFPSNFTHIKRDEKLTYAKALCNGENLYDKIKAVYQGAPSRGVTFTQQDLNNGWSRVTEHILPDQEWDGFFNEVLDRLPGRNEVSKIQISQDQFFTNSAGTRVDPSNGYYTNYYIRSAAAIIVSDIHSPKIRRERQGRPPAEIPSLVPTLNRFSDVAWTVWSLLLRANNVDVDGPEDDAPENQGKDPLDASRLRYIGYDSISNVDSVNVIEEIIEAVRAEHAEGIQNLEYPGLVFDLDSPNALALLGSPIGYGVGWILMDRFRELGARKVTVNLFTGEDPQYYCLLWHLGNA